MPNRSLVSRAATTVGAVLALTLASGCDAPPTESGEAVLTVPPSYSHGSFTSSTGIYRVPFVDASDVTVSNDHHDHNPVNRIDMVGNVANLQIVAAASGIIRAIVDWHGNSNGLGDGLAADGVTAQNDNLEHSCQDAADMNGNAIPNSVVAGLCQSHNNYVWVEHPNGEWTKYTHFQTGSVSANNWQVGDWIEAGDVLGIEGDVGRASGRHLHFEVGLPNDPTDLTPFTALGGFMAGSAGFGVNLVPRVCDADNVDYLYSTGVTYTANPCDHAAPTVAHGGPYQVNEGSTVLLDGTGSTDPDGRPLTFSWTPGDALDDTTLAQPTFDGVDDGVTILLLRVFDQVEALWDSASTTVTVANVAPTVTIDPAQVTAIDEGSQLLVKANFTDPGVLDAPFTAKIECNDVTGYAVTVDAAVQITSTDGPLTGTAAAYCPFGDTSESGDPAAGTFKVTVTVTDKDGGEGTASFDVTVHNTPPDPEISLDGATNVNGVPTYIGSVGETLEFSADVTDDGSDDLSLTWDWDDGSTAQATYLLNPPGTDPFPSPNESPRDETDEQSHAWAEPCYYGVTLTALDDDGGQGTAGANVIITGSSGRARSAGYWLTQVRGNRSGLGAETLGCYLAIAEHMSAVFDEERNGTGSLAEAADVLHTGGSKGDVSEELDQQLLAAWLNFANGAFGWNEFVDTTGDGVPDTAFSAAIAAAEAVRLDPNATRAELEAQKDVLEAINLMHGG
jgi:murein DD-endopeptidase MepM/ murein hydrolase activator NlpD